MLCFIWPIKANYPKGWDAKLQGLNSTDVGHGSQLPRCSGDINPRQTLYRLFIPNNMLGFFLRRRIYSFCGVKIKKQPPIPESCLTNLTYFNPFPTPLWLQAYYSTFAVSFKYFCKTLCDRQKSAKKNKKAETLNPRISAFSYICPPFGGFP